MNNEDFLNGIVYLMQTDDSADAPADAVQWTKNLFRARAAQSKPSLVERLFAVLQMDLAPGRAAFGERSAASGQARQLLFTAGETGLDLRVAAAGRDFRLNGQMLGGEWAAAQLTLAGGGRTLTARVGALGEFVFENVATGEYTLTIARGDREIVVENVPVG